MILSIREQTVLINDICQCLFGRVSWKPRIRQQIEQMEASNLLEYILLNEMRFPTLCRRREEVSEKGKRAS